MTVKAKAQFDDFQEEWQPLNGTQEQNQHNPDFLKQLVQKQDPDLLAVMDKAVRSSREEVSKSISLGQIKIP